MRFLVGVIGLPDGPLHVGLSRSKPYVPYEHVDKLDGVGALDGHLSGGSRLHWLEPHFPPSQRCSDGAGGLTAEGDIDGFTRRRFSEDPDRCVPLQQHVIANEVGQRYVCPACEEGE
jgi:hypothetical protein